jgi:serine/threonine protein kinase
MRPPFPDLTIQDPEGPAPSVTMPATVVAGTPAQPAEEAAPNAPRYSEVALLGEGGMGKVHLCRDERIGREVAMKVILPELTAKASARRRFLREASVQGQLEHPTIVPVHDIGSTPDGASFFTMKCVRGSTLEGVLEEIASRLPGTVERFTTRRLLAAFVNVCLGVDFAHSRGVVHRDLKPSNLMLGSFGEVYVLDWGIAKLADEAEVSSEIGARAPSDAEVGPHAVTEAAGPIVVRHDATPETAAGSLLGTLAYMAPEQMIGNPASVRSDVFALGAILFEILAGKPLREGGTTLAALLMGKGDARCSVRAPERNVAPELEAICVQATAVNPKDRFPSARALSEALEKYLEGDRDVIRRREQAAAHVGRARASLAGVSTAEDEQASRGAMRELGSAIALDPDNVEARAMLVEALTAPPREVPQEVREAIAQRTEEVIVSGVRKWPVILLSWLAFAPLIWWSGIEGHRMMAVGAGLMVLAALAGFIRARRGSGSWLEYASFVAAALAMVALGRAFGTLVVVPTLLATFAMGVQLHPHGRTRLVALGVSVFALVGAVVLELAGVVPHDQGIRPSALLLSGDAAPGDLRITLVVLLMNVTAMVASAFTVAEFRARLTDAEERLLVHAWQVRSMMPTDLGARSNEPRGAG